MTFSTKYDIINLLFSFIRLCFLIIRINPIGDLQKTYTPGGDNSMALDARVLAQRVSELEAQLLQLQQERERYLADRAMISR